MTLNQANKKQGSAKANGTTNPDDKIVNYKNGVQKLL
jgi:hypothetical protein